MLKPYMFVRKLIRNYILVLLVVYPIISTDAQEKKSAKNKIGKEECFNSNYNRSYREYEGRFRMDGFYHVKVFYRKGELLLRPYFWTTTQHLQQTGGDSFIVNGHENLKVIFIRGKANEITGINLEGFKNEKGKYQKLIGKPDALELLLSGDVNSGVIGLEKIFSNDLNSLIEIGKIILNNFPTKGNETIKYFELLAQKYPQNDEVLTLLGDSYIKVGRRADAIKKYKKAFQINSLNKIALQALQLLRVNPYSQKEIDFAWKPPFSLDELFNNPSPEEKNEILNEWSARDLSPSNVETVYEDSLKINSLNARVTIVSHTVHGFKHYGAIIVPNDAKQNSCPVILELKGISWNYFPMNLNDGLISPSFLCNEADRFVYVVPSFRGEKLIFNGKEFLSEGDRTDSWDGAADDAIALLNVALKIIPQINSKEICAFGKSRGGSVALLAAIRDKKINHVIDWSGPTDWFHLMGSNGWTLKELAEIGLNIHAEPNQTGGQFIERILKKSIEGKEGLTESRKRMIQSSPIFFAEYLPDTQVHYGMEDRMVPLLNGIELEKKIKSLKERKNSFQAFFYLDEGHDLDQNRAYSNSRKFILSMLK